MQCPGRVVVRRLHEVKVPHYHVWGMLSAGGVVADGVGHFGGLFVEVFGVNMEL